LYYAPFFVFYSSDLDKFAFFYEIHDWGTEISEKGVINLVSELLVGDEDDFSECRGVRGKTKFFGGKQRAVSVEVSITLIDGTVDGRCGGRYVAVGDFVVAARDRFYLFAPKFDGVCRVPVEGERKGLSVAGGVEVNGIRGGVL